MRLTMPNAQHVVAPTGEWSLATRAAQFAAVFLQVLVVGAFWGSWVGLSRFMDTLTPATFVTLGGLAATLAGSLLPAGRSEEER